MNRTHQLGTNPVYVVEGNEQEEIRKCFHQGRKGVAAEKNDQAGGKGALSDEGRKGVDGRLRNEDRRNFLNPPPEHHSEHHDKNL